ncbi:MAG TPA: hypothetical protein VG675_19470 [Bryobacteraceae bacterium]|nr:hypothetical protein [Bryobacteraceae bacterium]
MPICVHLKDSAKYNSFSYIDLLATCGNSVSADYVGFRHTVITVGATARTQALESTSFETTVGLARKLLDVHFIGKTVEGHQDLGLFIVGVDSL